MEAALEQRCREWYEAHGQAVYGYLRFHLRSAEEAEDLTAEVFLRAVRAAGRFDPSFSTSTHAFTNRYVPLPLLRPPDGRPGGVSGEASPLPALQAGGTRSTAYCGIASGDRTATGHLTARSGAPAGSGARDSDRQPSSGPRATATSGCAASSDRAGPPGVQLSTAEGRRG